MYVILRFDRVDHLDLRPHGALQVPLQGELDRLGVEGFAVVELDSLLQGEGPGLAILGSLPRFGQEGFDLEARIDDHQGFQDQM